MSQIKRFVTSLERYHPIVIDWDDAFARLGWRDVKEIRAQAMKVRSLGFFVDFDDRFLYCCTGRFDQTDDVADVHGYPVGMITRLQKLT